MPERIIAVYILTNTWNTVLYTGVTANLAARISKHQRGTVVGSFSSRYKLTKLVYFETTNDIQAAIAREKQIKAGSRKKKIRLIENINPDWTDLSNGFP